MTKPQQELVQQIRVFVASPGDVAEERKCMPDVFARLRRKLREVATIDEFLWEHDAIPGLGDAQEIINADLDRAHVVVVILWTRLGKPTARAPSGTAEEFLRSVARWKTTGSPHVLVYVCGSAPKPELMRSKEGLAELERLRQFLEDARLEGLTRSYDTPAEFKELVHDHLDVVIQRILKARSDPSASNGTRVTARTFSEATAALANYRAWLRDRHSRLLPYFSDIGKHLLDKVCVQLDVRADAEETLSELAGAPDRTEFGKARAVGTTLRELLLPSEQPKGVDAAEAPRWAIDGDPGAGKTTLARHLAHELAGNDSAAVPIFVSLAKLAAPSFDPIEIACTESLGEKRTPAHDALAAGLRALDGRERGLIFLLDGLDEVDTDVVDVDDVCKHVAELATRHPHVPMAISGRPIAFQRRDLGATFRSAHVQALDQGRREKLLDNLLGKDAEPVKAELVRRPVLAELARNPLMLTLVVCLGHDSIRARDPLPTNRCRLYQTAIDLFLRRGYGPVKKGVRDREVARVILRALSFALHKKGGESWTREQLSAVLTELRKASSSIDLHLRKTWKTNQDFLDDVATHSGIIGPYDGGDVLRYLHRSLREFLAAEALAQRDDDAQRRWMADWKAESDAFESESNEAVGGNRRSRRKAAPKPNPERWGDVAALLCGLVPEPLAVLEDLREVSAPLALRALPSVETLSARSGLEFLLATEGWNARSLLGVLRAWQLSRGDAHAALLGKRLADLSLDRLAWIWFALERTGAAPSSREFFALARPRLGPPPTLDWVRIPGGEFDQGSADSEYDDERPVRRVFVQAFDLTKTTVTRDQYRVFDAKHEFTTFGGVANADEPRLPATQIDWWSAYLFSRWIGGRLPSESEWEYACRAGTRTEYSFGDDKREFGAYGWYFLNSGKRPLAADTHWDVDKTSGVWGCHVHPVGLKRANPFGLHDMHGNVWEWCEDTWHESYEGAPCDGSAWVDGESESRAARGGSAWYTARTARSAFRSRPNATVRGVGTGFRLARSVTT